MKKDSLLYQNLSMKIKLKDKVNIRSNIFKVIIWYIAVNLTLLLTLYLVFRDIIINYAAYIIGFSSIISFVFLYISKRIIKSTYKIRLITKDNIQNDSEKMLYELVSIISEKYGLNEVPEVGIYKSGEVNAFATGISKNNSLISFSDSLINELDEEALAGVIGHEVCHIVNGDMVTMSIITGVICTLLILVSIPLLPFLIFKIADDSIGRAIFNIGAIVFIIASFLVTFISNFFSRNREFKADKGSAELLSKEIMIKALKEIERIHVKYDNLSIINSFKIYSKSKFWDVFSTHPCIKRRIERLKNL